MAMKIPKRTFKGRYEIAPLSAHARPTDEDQKTYCVVWQKNDKSEFHLCQHTYIHTYMYQDVYNLHEQEAAVNEFCNGLVLCHDIS